MGAQKVDSALLEPYSSIGRANVTQGPFIDTGINDERFGRVYLDRLQAWDIAKASVEMFDANQKQDLIGLLGGASWDEVESLNDQLLAKSRELEAARGNLDEVADAIAGRVVEHLNVVPITSAPSYRAPEELEPKVGA